MAEVWTPSLLDEACKGLVIKGEWTWPNELDAKRMERAVHDLLEVYPVLKSGDPSSFHCHKAPPFDRKKDRIQVTLDGCRLSISASHFIMDGFCFYRIANTLMALYSGRPLPQVLDFTKVGIRDLELPEEPDPSLFFTIPRNFMLLLLWKKLYRPRKRTFFVPAGRIASLKKEAKASSTSVLTALVYEKLGRRNLSFVQTVDHRGRFPGLDRDYGGNAATTTSPIQLDAGLDVVEAAHRLDQGLRERLSQDGVWLPQYLLLLKRKEAMLPFPIGEAWKRRSGCVIVNSFLCFDVWDGMAADGILPLSSTPPDLPDPVRFYPARGGVSVIMKL